MGFDPLLGERPKDRLPHDQREGRDCRLGAVLPRGVQEAKVSDSGRVNSPENNDPGIIDPLPDITGDWKLAGS
jgi:hypothetical protein